MKKIIIFSILFTSCISSKPIKYWGSEVYNKQKLIASRYANALRLGRDSLQIKGEFNVFAKSDTLFLIERVDEASLQTDGVIWDNKKSNVLLFQEEEIVHTKKGIYYKLKTKQLRYNDWLDPLKYNTEKFDTLAIGKPSILDGNRTFITRIIKGKSIQTYFFEDASISFNHDSILNKKSEQTVFEAPKNIELKSKEDYQKYELDIIKSSKWLEATDLNKESEKRKDISAFIIKWVSGSPSVNIELTEGITKIYGVNEPLLINYISSYCRELLENKSTSTKFSAMKSGILSMITVYKKGINIKKNNEMDNVIKINDENKLDNYVASLLKKN